VPGEPGLARHGQPQASVAAHDWWNLETGFDAGAGIEEVAQGVADEVER
jgi:hypothetical protein